MEGAYEQFRADASRVSHGECEEWATDWQVVAFGSEVPVVVGRQWELQALSALRRTGSRASACRKKPRSDG